VSSAFDTTGGEDVFFVFKGALRVSWDTDGRTETTVLGEKELIFNPPGQRKRFANTSAVEATFLRLLGPTD
jgi:mannose-6-phosphate isomerase-like protein (cupin superfamily)